PAPTAGAASLPAFRGARRSGRPPRHPKPPSAPAATHTGGRPRGRPPTCNRSCARLALGPDLVAAPASASASAAATAAAATVAVAARALLARLARRGVLRPLDELLRRDDPAVLVLLHELQADAATRLVDLLHEHVQDVATL